MRPKKPSSIVKQIKSDALLVSNLTNIAYLTGIEVSAGLLLITKQKMTLFVDSRYSEAATKEAYTHIAVADIEQLEDAFSRITTCSFEADDVTVARLKRWKKQMKKVRCIPETGVIEEFRRSKDAGEIRYFKKAQSITKTILKQIPSLLKGDITEKKLAEKLRIMAVELGADSLSFDPIVAFGTHTSRPHHHPTNRKLKKGHIVQIDVGAKYKGYCADQSAVLFTGAKTALQKKVLSAVQKAKRECIKQVKAGVDNRTLDMLARSILQEEGFDQYFTHSLGHGVGLDIHEGITLSTKAKKMALLKNEIITIEPGVYIPGKLGIRLEEEVIVR